MNHSKQITILSFAVAVLFVSVLFLLYLNFSKTPALISTPQTGIIPTEISAPTNIPTVDPTADWKTYTNKTYNFSIMYPNNWSSQSEGPTKDMWQTLSSPDLATAGAQEPKIGMVVNIQVFNQSQQPTQSDLQQFLTTNGILKYYKATKISDNITPINTNVAYQYEYQSTDNSSPYHFWGINVAKGDNIISLSITDFKEDPSLNTTQLANQILSTFKFTP